eukprot:m.219344 g.219344  ORF g.219344 m.219344 type:complete len:175 (+) comp18694_c0_seq12:251-775(+)
MFSLGRVGMARLPAALLSLSAALSSSARLSAAGAGAVSAQAVPQQPHQQNQQHARISQQQRAASTEVSKAKVVGFGAGCFWGTERFFRDEFGSRLVDTEVGYQGGNTQSPTYEDICTGTTGHAEVLRVTYTPEQVELADLVMFFFRMHNPTTLNRQGWDMGTQYRSVIFVEDAG